jgi:hypothetical protein
MRGQEISQISPLSKVTCSSLLLIYIYIYIYKARILKELMWGGLQGKGSQPKNLGACIYCKTRARIYIALIATVVGDCAPFRGGSLTLWLAGAP